MQNAEKTGKNNNLPLFKIIASSLQSFSKTPGPREITQRCYSGVIFQLEGQGERRGGMFTGRVAQNQKITRTRLADIE